MTDEQHIHDALSEIERVNENQEREMIRILSAAAFTPAPKIPFWRRWRTR